MLTKTIGLSFGWAGVLLGSALVFAPGCGGTGDTSGTERCTPNQQVSCDCKDGSKSVQVCAADGLSFEACQCPDGSGGSTGSGTGGAGGSTGTTQSGLCGNGIQDPGECDNGEFACPQDCMGTGGAGGGTTTSSNTCEGVVTYAGMIPDVPSAWGAKAGANGKTGFDAGVALCSALAAEPCTYERVRDAEMAGELKDVPMGTTMWIHRTTPEMVNGVVSQPGAGGRCNDWIYTTNHISDGEYATFDQAGVPTYHLDNDTFFDGVNTTHTITGDLQCGGVMRAIPCCFPACVP
ncbi:MAG: hypothetical protein U0441_15130 [Polyangiaceae bacterium]